MASMLTSTANLDRVSLNDFATTLNPQLVHRELIPLMQQLHHIHIHYRQADQRGYTPNK